MPPKRVKKVMTVPINVIFGHLQVGYKRCSCYPFVYLFSWMPIPLLYCTEKDTSSDLVV